MRTRIFHRTVSALLAFFCLVAILPYGIVAEEKTVYVLTASDFQQGSHEGSSQIVSSIISSVKAAGYSSIDGFLFAGDYDRNTIGDASQTRLGLDALSALIDSEYPDVGQKIFVQGNHDPASVAGLAAGGANDAEDYGVFVINNDDYMWYNSNETKIKETAGNLRSYFLQKEQEGYTKPIFVISHLPLHYSMRTKVDGDAQYANYLFEELNEAGQMGLNVIFLYGHDHSHGWDNYLGGSSVCLLPGDVVPIAQASRTEFRNETLYFTYMNAGYTGYYSSNNGADDSLTMCLFAIKGSQMTVSRFDESGLHDLKRPGTYNTEYDDREILQADTRTITSPAVLSLSQSVLPKNACGDDAFDVRALYTGDGIEVTRNADPDAAAYFGDPEAYREYVCYTIEPVGTNVGKADLTVPLDDADAQKTKVYLKTASGFVRMDGVLSNSEARLSCRLPAVVVLARPNNPYESSAFSSLLWKAEAQGQSWKFFHLEKELYLGCESNATLNSAGAALTLSSVTGGVRLALSAATGSKAAGESLHFGTANRCSFGEYSPFVLYEYTGEDTYTEVETPTDGGVYLIAYRSGSNAYLLTGNTVGDRIETELRSVPLAEDDRPDEGAYAGLLFLAGGSEGAYTFRNTSSDLYLTCSGNATFGEEAAFFSVTAVTGGFHLALQSAIGGKSAGDALHFGSSNRISFGTASIFRIYRYLKDERFEEAESVIPGQTYLIAYPSGSALYAISGTTYSSGTSSRIETQPVQIRTEDPDAAPYQDSAFLSYLYKAETLSNGVSFKHIESAQYLSCAGNATLGAEAAPFTVSGEKGSLSIALAAEVSGKAAGSALHLGSADRVSLGTASPVFLYEYVEDDTFTSVDTVQEGKVYLIVFAGSERALALTGTVYNPGTGSRIETAEVEVPIASQAVPYDVNDDREVNILDVSILLNYLSGQTDGIEESRADVNGSGFVNIADVTALLNYIAL